MILKSFWRRGTSFFKKIIIIFFFRSSRSKTQKSRSPKWKNRTKAKEPFCELRHPLPFPTLRKASLKTSWAWRGTFWKLPSVQPFILQIRRLNTKKSTQGGPVSLWKNQPWDPGLWLLCSAFFLTQRLLVLNFSNSIAGKFWFISQDNWLNRWGRTLAQPVNSLKNLSS